MVPGIDGIVSVFAAVMGKHKPRRRIVEDGRDCNAHVS